jgi:hypothetical protein
LGRFVHNDEVKETQLMGTLATARVAAAFREEQDSPALAATPVISDTGIGVAYPEMRSIGLLSSMKTPLACWNIELTSDGSIDAGGGG